MKNKISVHFLCTILLVTSLSTVGILSTTTSGSNTPGNVTYPDNLSQHSNSADYLIITSDEFYSNSRLEDFANHKASYNGFDVAVVNVNNPFIGNTETDIKDFILYVYENWGASVNNRLGYVLLVGDIEHVDSSHHLDNMNRPYVSDLWYGCFCYNSDTNHFEEDDDYLTIDIPIGRFPVDDSSELDTIVSKSITYEQNYCDEEEWHKSVLTVLGKDVSPSDIPYHVREGLVDLAGWNTTEVIWQEGGTATQVQSNIAEGKSIVVYAGHGDTDGWLNINYMNSNILALTNGERLPIVLSQACLTGSFQGSSDCMGEAFLKNANGGAVAFIGASQEVGAGFGLGDALYSSIFDQFEYILGDIVVYIFSQSGTPQYNLLGDPALDFSGSIGQYDKPDLAISHTDITTSPATESDETIISAIIHNIGDTDAENVTARIIAVDTNGLQHFIGDAVIEVIPADSQSTLLYMWDLYDTNDKENILVIVDPLNEIDESYELNNQAGTKVDIPIETAYVDDDFTSSTPGFGINRFKKIQEAIKAVDPYGTVHVSSGVYTELITISKPINLYGEDRESTIIDGSRIITMDILEYDSIAIDGAKGDQTKSDTPDIQSAKKSIVTISSSTGEVTISGFTITNLQPVTARRGARNGIHLYHSDNNVIAGNWIEDLPFVGILLSTSSDNIIVGNLVNDTKIGVKIDSTSNNNQLYYNIFTNSRTTHAINDGENVWSYRYPYGGNMWGDHDSHDGFRGPNQDLPGDDGICDLPGGGINPFIIQGTSDDVDMYPRNDLNKYDDYFIADAHGPYEGAIDERIFFSGNAFGSFPPYGNYLWDFGTGDTSSMQNPTYVYSSPGIYTVTLTVTDRLGSSKTNITTVTIDETSVPPVYNINEAVYYQRIQDAIDFASPGDTIEVSSGIYFENIVVDTAVLLVGQNKETTVIDGSEQGIVVKVTAPGTTIQGFTIRNSSSNGNGISIFADNTIIFDNIVIDNYRGIYAGSSDNQILSNIAVNNSYCGIFLKGAFESVCTDNVITNNSAYGLIISNSRNSTIRGNIISISDKGIYVFASGMVSPSYPSENNSIYENEITANYYGIMIKDLGLSYLPCNDNMIYHNNLIDNTQNAYDNCDNSWDNGIEGNYWDDWSGSDPYVIEPGYNQDNYPLTDPWPSP